jgi:hypothetical protein
MILTRSLCWILSILIASTQVFGQQPGPTPVQSVPSRLGIAILEGENAVNSISLGSSIAPVVEVHDANDFPVEGATVVFTLPDSGPGGTFPGNQISYTTRSDARGQATAPFLINGLPGKFTMMVTATSGNRIGEATITQTNAMGTYIGTAVPKKPWYKKWWIWTIAAGAVTGVVLGVTLSGGGGSGSTGPTSSVPVITVTPGSPSLGGPH